jgi:hypothetical protein
MRSASALAIGAATIGAVAGVLVLTRGRRARAAELPYSDAAPGRLAQSASTPAVRGRGSAHVGQATPPALPPVPVGVPMPTSPALTFSFPPSGDPVLDAYRKRHAPDEYSTLVAQWDPIVAAKAILAGVPFAFARGYLAAESGGNVCAVGELTATGPDGSPKEIGLFQIYNPDDFKALGVDPKRLVAYCVRPAPGQKNPQRLARPMTADEMAEHVDAGIANIVRHRHRADQILAADGYTWRTDSPDYWSAVKLIHALPVEENPGFAQVKAHLGRAPTSWREFRTTYEQIQPRARFDAAKASAHPEIQQDGYFRALDNAEWTGSHVQSSAAVA